MNHIADRAQVVSFLLDRLVERIGGDPAAIGLDEDLIELGVRSIDAVLVSGEIEDCYGVEIDPVLLFECRTVNRVADSVLETLARR